MAGSGVSVKMGVTGVSQFKQGMKESQAAVKNLEQQLKLNEAQLKATGNEELYLQNKTGLLTKQIEEQKRTVSQATQALEAMKRNGVEQSSVAFQNMQQQVYKASTQLMEMQAELNGVGESGQEAADNVSEMNYQLNNISRNVSFENVVNGIEKITDAMAEAGRAAYNMGKKLVQAVLSGGQWADNLQETADKWEMSPEDVYRMQQTANIIDTDAETIFKAKQKMIQAMGDQGNKDAMGAFSALGISNLVGTNENIEDVFWQAGQGLMQMEDKVARNEYAIRLFGRSWTDLIPIFQTGREAYEEMFNSWDWMGDKEFKALTAVDDESKKTQSAWENIVHTFEAALSSSMTEILQTLQGVLHEFNQYLTSEEGQSMLQTLGESVSGLFEDLTNIEPGEVVGKIVYVFEKIREGLRWIIENRQSVVTALEGIAVGFGMLKLTGLAMDIGRIVSGLQRLFIGGGTGTEGTTTTATATIGNAGTVTFDSLGAQMLVTAGAMREVEKLMDWGRASEGDVHKWGQYGVEQGYITQEHAQQQIEFVDKLNEISAGIGTSGGASFGEELTESADRMTQVAGEMNGELAGLQQSNADMTAAAKDLLVLTSLPAEIRQAVVDGMASVTININEGAVSAIGERISYGYGGKVQAMTK